MLLQRRFRRRRRHAGFTYLSVIILVAIIGLVAAAALKMGALLQRRAAEQQLLDIGAQFSDALQSYAAATPPGQPQQPASLQELLRDPRFPGVRRHLRQVFVDPITGKAEWGIMYLADQRGVVGVYSLSPAQPIKVGNFEPRFQTFDGKSHLSDWKFVTAGQNVVQSAAPPGTATPPASEPLPAPTSTPPEPPPEPASEPVPEPVPEPETTAR